jgi:hypothetical protein
MVRPRLRWLEGEETDLRVTELNECNRQTGEKNGKVMNEATFLGGSYTQTVSNNVSVLLFHTL